MAKELTVLEKAQGCADYIRSKTDFRPKVLITLGSGLGDYANEVRIECEIPYSEIPGFPVSTAPGHDGRFIFGYVGEVPVACMKGRIHYYEGYDITDCVLPARVMGLLGCEILFLTNASGGVSYLFSAGDLMLITDHISVFAPNPLIGPAFEPFGPRFPDMSNVYDKKLQEVIWRAACETGIPLKSGVYCQLTGPSYESPAEIRMLRTLGVDAVGMSTVAEAIAAHAMGMKVCGVSTICNMAAGMLAQPLNHEEVLAAGVEAGPRFTKLVTESVKLFANL